jgi:soluble lytic murein transglycosylase
VKAQGADPADLEAKIKAEPAFQRASALLRLGQRLRARWEVEDLLDTYTGKPASLYTLGTLLAARGAYDLSARAAQQALAALPDQSLLAAPRALQKLAYPLPYADLLEQQRQARGVDPLLLAALIRQESVYDPYATSSVGARGLTQVMPDTGAQIAAQLGQDFSADDLYRPVVSVDYGAAFLKDVLHTFGDRVYPALASYNAGPGAAQNWIDTYGDDDADVWAERIPYAETYHYVSIVFTNYGRYRLIYGAAG